MKNRNIKFRDMQRNWDEVLIIDLLSPDERFACRVSETVSTVLQANQFGVHMLQCSSKEDVFASLETALKRAHDRSFMLHFTAHGSMDGICNQDAIGIITWQELREPIAKINKALNGDLIINMIACEGIHGIKIDAILTPEPAFYGLIGPTRKIELTEARELCREFYNKLMANGEILAAVAEIVDHNKEPLVWAKSAQMLRHQVLRQIESKFI